MPIKHNDYRTARAIDFYKKTSIYFGLAKTTAWKASDYADSSLVPADPEKKPPVPRGTDTFTSEVVGYRKADKVYLIVPYNGVDAVPQGTIIIEYADTKWRVVSEANAKAEKVKHVYVETTILPTDFASTTYRKVAVFSGLTRKTGVDAGKFQLLPTEVQDQGFMEILDYRQFSNLNGSNKEFLSFITQF
jgi:hypothetical protein